MKHLGDIAWAVIIVGISAWLWTQFAPVIIFTVAEIRARTADSVTMYLTTRKIRGCAVVGGSFVGWYETPDGWEETPFSWPDDPSPDSTLPTAFSRQKIGLAKWDNLPSTTTSVRATLIHDCGGKPKVTILGGFDLPRRDENKQNE